MTETKTLTQLLALKKVPVAVHLRDEAPHDMPRIGDVAPSGCTYWKYASEGQRFYTVAEDHLGCPIGALTHGIEVAGESAAERKEILEIMSRLSYVRDDEVANIPTLPKPLGVVIYTPLAEAEDPDVILVRGNARQMMLLAEAAIAAGIAAHATMGRPTCAAIPEVIATGACITNLACIGNRVYTELEDDELYLALPGSRIDDVIARLPAVIAANQVLESMHKENLA